MYGSIEKQAQACLNALESHAADPSTLALHDPIYAILSAIESQEILKIPAQARALAIAVEHQHPVAAQARQLLGELAELGVWSPILDETALESAIREVGVDPQDPDAGDALRQWLLRQEKQLDFLEERTDELRFKLRRSERFSSLVVGVAVLLGLLLLVSLLGQSWIPAEDEVPQVGRETQELNR